MRGPRTDAGTDVDRDCAEFVSSCPVASPGPVVFVGFRRFFSRFGIVCSMISRQNRRTISCETEIECFLSISAMV